MATIRDVQALFAYGYWANAELLRVVEALPADDYRRNVAGSYGSVRNTLVHMLSAEWGWLERCGGWARGPALRAEDYPEFAQLAGRWRDVEAQMRAFLAGLTDADLERMVEFAFPGGPAHTLPVGDLLRHAAIHGIHHRGQAVLLLRELGKTPGNLDLLLYALRGEGK